MKGCCNTWYPATGEIRIAWARTWNIREARNHGPVLTGIILTCPVISPWIPLKKTVPPSRDPG